MFDSMRRAYAYFLSTTPPRPNANIIGADNTNAIRVDANRAEANRKADSVAVFRSIGKIIVAKDTSVDTALKCKRLCDFTRSAIQLEPSLVSPLVQQRINRGAWLNAALSYVRCVPRRKLDSVRVFCLQTRREESLLSFLVIELLCHARHATWAVERKTIDPTCLEDSCGATDPCTDDGSPSLPVDDVPEALSDIIRYLLSLHCFCDPVLSSGTATESPLARVLLFLAYNGESDAGAVRIVRVVAKDMLTCFPVASFLQRAKKKYPIPQIIPRAVARTCPGQGPPVISAEEELWWVYLYACEHQPWIRSIPFGIGVPER